MKLSEAIQIYLEGQRSSETAKVYRGFLRVFFSYLNDIDIETITIADITKFASYYKSRSTEIQVSKALMCLRSFFRYFRTRYGLDVISNERIIVDKPGLNHWKPVPMNELIRLFKSFDQTKVKELRNLCICMTVFCTGVREFELLQLKKSAIDWRRGEAEIIGKGRKPRTIYFTEECLNLLKKYISMRTDQCDALFVNHAYANSYDGKPLSATNIRTYMPQWGRKVGIERLHCHRLRKSFGTELYRKSNDIRKIQLLMGHSSVATTQVYIGVDDIELKEFHHRNMSETNEFYLIEKKNGNTMYEIKGFCCDQSKLPKLKKAIKSAAKEILK